MILMEITNLKESGHVGERVEVQWLMRLAGVLISGSASICLSPDWWNAAVILVFWHHSPRAKGPHLAVHLHPNESGKDLMGETFGRRLFSLDHHSHSH
jgi:hypothetical protein